MYDAFWELLDEVENDYNYAEHEFDVGLYHVTCVLDGHDGNILVHATSTSDDGEEWVCMGKVSFADFVCMTFQDFQKFLNQVVFYGYCM